MHVAKAEGFKCPEKKQSRLGTHLIIRHPNYFVKTVLFTKLPGRRWGDHSDCPVMCSQDSSTPNVPGTRRLELL